MHRGRVRHHADALDRLDRADASGLAADDALRQPDHRVGDVRRGARRPEEPLRPAFQLVHVLSREPRDVELFSGRLEADRLRRLLAVLVPIDGGRPRVAVRAVRDDHDARAVLEELGVPRRAGALRAVLRRRAAAGGGPARSRGHRRDEQRDRRTRRAEHHRGDAGDKPILDSAQASRADLPFACKGGVCGTCRAQVTEGEVDMRRNYALEPDEVEAGFVLTCQTSRRPTGHRGLRRLIPRTARRQRRRHVGRRRRPAACSAWRSSTVGRRDGRRPDDRARGHGQRAGHLHGGLVASLADSAFAVACNSHGVVTVAAGFDVSFLAPPLGDELVADRGGACLRGRSGVCDVTVASGDGTAWPSSGAQPGAATPLARAPVASGTKDPCSSDKSAT